MPERGVGLVELAILLPLVMLLVAGIIDFGWTIRELQSLHNSAREGARVAASYARKQRQQNGGVPAICANNIPLTPCDAANLAITSGDTIAEVGRKAACSFLQSANADRTAFDVTPEIVEVASYGPHDRDKFFRIRVEVRKKSTVRACFICWPDYFEGLRPMAQSTFALEDICLLP